MRIRRLSATLLAASLLTAQGRASAQSSDNKAAAEALFVEGRRLMEEGKYRDACAKLESSQKLDPGAGTLMNLAACYEKTGQTASAWVTYKDAATASAVRHPDWAERARERVAALEPTLSRLTITVAASVPGLVVERDGHALDAGALGTPLPIDPGDHAIDAKAPGRVAFHTTVTIAASEASQKILIPSLQEDKRQSSAPGPARAPVSSTQKTVGFVVGGVGLAGMIAGGVFGAMAAGKKSDAQNPAFCTSDLARCNSAGKALVDDAKSAATLSTVALIAGGALAATGVVLIVSAPSAREPERATARSLRVGLGASGLWMGGDLQ